MNKLRQLFARPYSVTNSKGKRHWLAMKKVSLRGGKLVPIYFFITKRWPNSNQGELQRKLPDGYRINENPRNGFLTVIRDNQGEHEDEG